MRYPHMDNRPDSFPHIGNVDVFKYENTFDYARYDETQMQLCMCTVPWDMGEAHIGNRTISGIGNVVYFADVAARDAWFDAIPDDKCYRFETKYKELHSTQTLDVEIPFDICALYNYVTVEYNLFANDDSPVKWEDKSGLRKWFWFIRSVEFIAPNTTRLHIMLDAWQTFIYDFDITGMILERGHAPMFAMSASEYLTNPIENCADLLTEDVNFGRTMQVKHVQAHVFNDANTIACIACTSDPRSSNWGVKGDTWRTPAAAHYTIQGATSTMVFAMDAQDLNTFLTNVETYVPQFKQTVLAVWFCSRDLLSLSYPFVFCGVDCYIPNASRKGFDFLDLDKSMFGYPNEYADIAKLYTMPYAHIEITDERGEVMTVAIEGTTGTIDINAGINIVWPYVTIDAHLMGVGGITGSRLTFANVGAKSFSFSGRWYDYLYSWQVPTFAVIMQAADVYDYATDFDRKQRVIDYTTVYNNTVDSADTALSNARASADTARDNAHASADTAKTNADASADLVTDNMELAKAANNANATESNTVADRSLNYIRTYNFDVYDSDNAITTATATSQIQATEEQAAISAASGAATSAVGAISAAASGNIAGAVSSAIGGVIGAASTLASSSVSVHLTQAEAAIAIQNNGYHAEAATTKSSSDITNQKLATSEYARIQNVLIKGQASNTSAVEKANATRNKTTQRNNATATNTTDRDNALATRNTAVTNAQRDRQRAIDDIANDIKQAALRTPEIFGQFADGQHATTKPMALFAHVVTQDKAAISAAGDEFLRYGYRLDKQWHFDGNWNVGKHFTYWKLRDFWVRNLNVPDMYADSLRFFLFGGVTVWRRPEDIGNVSIYENGAYA